VKCIDVAALASSQGGEYVLGDKDLHTQTCYLVYGRLEAHEGNRLIRPGTAYEEILCVVHGRLLIHTNRGDVTLPEGNAVYVRENESFLVSNPNDEPSVYVVAGGRRNLQDVNWPSDRDK
jgi:ethanolamine utilization protein EutQ (cupin superfamily)